MSRSQKPNSTDNGPSSGPRPVSLAEYIRATEESCGHGQCCRDQAALLAASEQYVNDPKAPWNKHRRGSHYRPE